LVKGEHWGVLSCNQGPGATAFKTAILHDAATMPCPTIPKCPALMVGGTRIAQLALKS
jgi:hypothetical protein